jgi:predicted AlkP superfamily pyrophosphatase or phosphodiesterase
MKNSNLFAKVSLGLSGLVFVFACARSLTPSSQTNPIAGPHNLILFVADGLRHYAVNGDRAPTLWNFKQRGVFFTNSHSIFPTLTMANASTLSTGHLLGDSGIFSNTLYSGFPVTKASNSVTPFLEDDGILNELDVHFDRDLLDGETVLQAAHQAGYATAAVGKVGPAMLQLLPDRDDPNVMIIDDQTGSPSGVPLSSALKDSLTKAGLPLVTPSRGSNGQGGTFQTAGTLSANTVQQGYFVNAATQAALPLLKNSSKPFVMVFWSRDPDGTQHNQGDSLNSITPGINGPTSFSAIKNADSDLQSLLTQLDTLGLTASTNVVVTSDHGFSTISRQSAGSYSSTQKYTDVQPGFLPPSFVAIDLAHALGLNIYDPDNGMVQVQPTQWHHSTNAILAMSPSSSEIVVAANGGSDLIYLLGKRHSTQGASEVVNFLLTQDYVSGIFIADDLGSIPGTLPMSAIGLMGSAKTPHPSISISFKSWALKSEDYKPRVIDCSEPTFCGVEIADTFLQQGQGNHGSFGRQDTFNFTAATGPDFKAGLVSDLPINNADVGTTIAYLFNLNLKNGGTAGGRVIAEALQNSVQTGDTTVTRQTLTSVPASNGLKTVLQYQTLGNFRYFDAAGFPGRTIGLDSHP